MVDSSIEKMTKMNTNCLINEIKVHPTIDGLIDLEHPSLIGRSDIIKEINPSETHLNLLSNFLQIKRFYNEEATEIHCKKSEKYYVQINYEKSPANTISQAFYITNRYNSIPFSFQNFENNYESSNIHPGDRIKCGRVSYDFLLFVNENSNYDNQMNEIMDENNLNNSESIRTHKEILELSEPSSEDICRICLSNSSFEAPLIKLCRCKGSIQFVHLECVKAWIETKKVSFEMDKSYSFHWRSLKCESCQDDYPIFIKYKGVIQPLVNIKFPQKRNFFIFKSIIEDKNQYFSLHLCFSDNINDYFILGRDLNADIRVGDYSVSTSNSIFILDNNKLFLFDYNSKYGTYIQIKNRLALEMEKEYKLLLGKYLIFIKLTNFQGEVEKFSDSLQKNKFKYFLSRTCNDTLNICPQKNQIVNKIFTKAKAKERAKIQKEIKKSIIANSKI